MDELKVKITTKVIEEIIKSEGKNTSWDTNRGGTILSWKDNGLT